MCNGLRIIIGFLTNGERIAARALYARTHHLSQLPAPYRLQRDLEPFIESLFLMTSWYILLALLILLYFISLFFVPALKYVVDHTNSPDSSPDFYFIEWVQYLLTNDQQIENKVCLFDNYTNIHLIDNQSFSFLLK